MRAIRFERFGPPSDLKLQELPQPVLTPDEVLVEIRAAAVNPSDHRESRLFGVDSRTLDVIACAAVLEALTPGFEANALKASSTIENYLLEDAVKAYEVVLNRSTTSKVVLTPLGKR